MCNMMISAILDPTPTMSGLRSVSGVMHLQGGLRFNWVYFGARMGILYRIQENKILLKLTLVFSLVNLLLNRGDDLGRKVFYW